ncbi:hypothetical protein WJ92_27805 [Burkholderia ubonensis]|nr:hypothetical protein WJ92_27805 [Burkholderia ubonensis]
MDEKAVNLQPIRHLCDSYFLFGKRPRAINEHCPDVIFKRRRHLADPGKDDVVSVSGQSCTNVRCNLCQLLIHVLKANI